MVEWTIESGINQGTEVKICSILFLYSKEGWISMVGSRLLKVKSSYYQEQNTITINQRSYWQTEGSQILQQVGLDLGIQQHLDKRRWWMESSLLNK